MAISAPESPLRPDCVLWTLAALAVFGFIVGGVAAVVVALRGDGGGAFLLLAASGLLLVFGVSAAAFYRGRELAAAGRETDASARAMIALVLTAVSVGLMLVSVLVWPLAGLAACYGVWAIGQTAPWTFGRKPAPGVRRSGAV